MTDQVNAAATGQPATPAPQSNTASTALSGSNQQNTIPTNNDGWAGLSLDPETAGLIKVKGYKNPNELAKAYIESTKMIGADKIAIPGRDAKPEDIKAYHRKLGAPENPDGYGFKKPEKGSYDDNSAKWFAKTAFEAGVPVKQAQALHDSFVQHIALQETAMSKQAEVDRTNLWNELKDEWGVAHDRNLDIAKRAVAKYLPKDQAPQLLDKIEEAVGAPALVKLFHAIGKDMLEDNMERGSKKNESFLKSPTEAKNEINRLFSDKEFMSQYMDRNNSMHNQAKQRMADLHKMAVGGN